MKAKHYMGKTEALRSRASVFPTLKYICIGETLIRQNIIWGRLKLCEAELWSSLLKNICLGETLIRRNIGLVFGSPVRSGFLTPRVINRNRNRSFYFQIPKKTGPNRCGPVHIGFLRSQDQFKPVL